MLKLTTAPQFALIDTEHDTPVVIKGNKTKAVLVLLAFAPQYTRSRSWIKKRLWSDRSDEQASGSLRQCVSDIKKSLENHQGFLVTSNSNISLDVDKIESIENTAKLIANAEIAIDGDILEDLDVIKDPQFKLWLSTLRSEVKTAKQARHHQETLSTAKPRSQYVVFFDKQFGPGLHENVVGSELLTSISRFLLEMQSVSIMDSSSLQEKPLGSKSVRGCCLKLNVQANEKSVLVQVGVVSLVDSRILWSDRTLLPVSDDFSLQSFELLSLTGNLVAQLSQLVSSSDEHIDASELSSQIVQRAVTNIFSLEKDRMQQADRELDEIYKADPAGQYLAWRAFIRSLAVFQHRDANFLDDNESSTTLAEEALRSSPTDSVSLMVTSQFEYLHRGNAAASLHFAKQSVASNPLNALAWAVLSNTQLVCGQNKDAAVSAKKALALGANSPFRHYLQFFTCMALSSLKEYEQAAVHAEVALAYSSSFIAPLRYLLPLYKATGQEEKFEASLQRLKSLEPKFSLSRYSEASYPVNTLRKIELIDFVV